MIPPPRRVAIPNPRLQGTRRPMTTITTPVIATTTMTTTMEITSIKFILLDSYNIALMRRSATHSTKRQNAVEILQQANGKKFGEGNENSPEGLEGLSLYLSL